MDVFASQWGLFIGWLQVRFSSEFLPMLSAIAQVPPTFGVASAEAFSQSRLQFRLGNIFFTCAMSNWLLMVL